MGYIGFLIFNVLILILLVSFEGFTERNGKGGKLYWLPSDKILLLGSIVEENLSTIMM